MTSAGTTPTNEDVVRSLACLSITELRGMWLGWSDDALAAALELADTDGEHPIRQVTVTRVKRS